MDYLLPNFNLDIWAIIISYLKDPRDIISLYNTNKYIFSYIIPKLVKEIYINPEITVYIPHWVIYKLNNLRSVHCDIRIKDMKELNNIINDFSNIKEMNIRISRKINRTLFNIATFLMCDDHLSIRSYRVEKYNHSNYSVEDIWIGKGKLSHGYTNEANLLLLLYRKEIKSLLTDAFYFDNLEYNRLVSIIPNLVELSYIDCGYRPCTSFQLQLMLISNSNLKELQFIPCDYIYKIDNKTKFEHIDMFVLNLYKNLDRNNTVYDKITTLSIPMSVRDTINIKNIFPNLSSIGFRYVVSVSRINDYKFDITNLDILYFKYDKITIYLYIVFETIEIRQYINRDNDIQQQIYKQVCNILSFRYNRAHIINMNSNLPSHILARDNWLFDSTY